MNRNTTIEGTEKTVCEACARIPLAHLVLDLEPPLDGWPAFFRERGVEVVEDDLGRPSVGREVLGALLAEREVEEARLAAQRAEQAAALRTPVPAGVPAQEGSSALESMMMAPGYVSARRELGNGRVSVTQELLDERLARDRFRLRFRIGTVRLVDRRAKFLVDAGNDGDALLDRLARNPKAQARPARPYGLKGWLVEG